MSEHSLVVLSVAVSAAIASTGCNNVIPAQPTDGFSGYEPCEAEAGAACLLLTGISEDAERFEVTVVHEDENEVRIRIDAIGLKTTDDLIDGISVELSDPLDNRNVVDDTTGNLVRPNP